MVCAKLSSSPGLRTASEITCGKLAQAGHTVYASMRETKGRNAHRIDEVRAYTDKHGVDLRAIELDVSSESSTNSAIESIIAESGRLDVVVHNAGQIVYGPTEALTSEQLAELYDTNVLSTQRVNRAALPQLRKQGQGLLVWVSSSSAHGGSVPFLGAYASSKAALDALALSYAAELARWGIETTIIVPGALGPGHYFRSGRPRDAIRAEEYADGPTADISEVALAGLAHLSPRDLGTRTHRARDRYRCRDAVRPASPRGFTSILTTMAQPRWREWSIAPGRNCYGASGLGIFSSRRSSGNLRQVP